MSDRKSAAFAVAIFSMAISMARCAGAKILFIAGGFVAIEQREHAENLIVERAIQGRTADTVRKSFFFGPCFGQHAVHVLIAKSRQSSAATGYAVSAKLPGMR